MSTEKELKAAWGIADNCQSQEIPAAEAKQMINAAKAYIKEVNNTRQLGAIDILQGVRIPDCLWQDVLATLGAKPKVWGMLALDKGKLKIIFQGKSANGGNYKYFNFTKPCPSLCPS